MSKMKIKLKDGTYKSFSAVQFTENYLEKVSRIYDYAISIGHTSISSKDIQSYLSKEFGIQDSDLRSLLSLLKKLGFINEFTSDSKGDCIFTMLGELFVHIIKIKMNMQFTPSLFQDKINNAFKLVLQKGLLYAQEYSEDLNIPSNFWLLVCLFQRLQKLSGKEYLFAISCSDDNSLDNIITMIKDNREDNVEYEIYNKEKNTLIANTAYSYNLGILLQAGIIEEDSNSFYRMTNNIFN